MSGDLDRLRREHRAAYDTCREGLGRYIRGEIELPEFRAMQANVDAAMARLLARTSPGDDAKATDADWQDLFGAIDSLTDTLRDGKVRLDAFATRQGDR